jgi:quinol monooxygenase YgiN
MSQLIVFAKVVARPDAVESVKSELLKLISPTRKENGCLSYNLHQDNDEPTVFVFHETWESLNCLEKHMNTDHFKKYINNVEGKIAEKVVHKMTLIE